MSLSRTLNASSVAIVGASQSETKRGYQAIQTLLGQRFEGAIYPVNPKENMIQGLTCYPSVSSVPGKVDLALITTPAATIPHILEDCAKKGIAGAVIIAGGFGETGRQGRKLENQMVQIAKKAGIRLIGPNTSGMINVHSNLNLVGLNHVPRGDIALISQSGNMALSLITEAAIKSQKGFSYYVGVGNEADIRFHEYLAFFREDPKTEAILMYVEGMRDGRSFLQEAYRTTRHKPIIILKSGRTATGRRSAGSHTGALAGMSEVARTAFERAGIVITENSDEMFPAAETLSCLPPVHNNGVAILADGGGHATIAADILTDCGIELPSLNEKTKTRLREILPAAASIRNPIDVAGGADANPTIFAECARVLLSDSNIGGLLVVGLFGGYSIRFARSLAFMEEDAAHQMGKLVRDTKKPIVVHSLYSYAKPHSLDLLRYYNIPVYDSLEIASKCMGVLTDYGNYIHSYQAKTDFVLKWGAKAKKQGRAIIERALKEGRKALLEPEARDLLSLHGVPMCRAQLAENEDQAVAIVNELDCECVVKVVSPQILHKSEAAGVKLNLENEKQVRRACREIITGAENFDPNAKIYGFLVSPMAKAGLEVIVGTKVDDQFGLVILFGIGGIMVEVLKDVSFRVLPITNRSARMMIDDIHSSTLLDGIRNQPPLDKKALRKLLLNVSEVVESYPEIQEMDLNPVIVYTEGLSVVDARILLKKDANLSAKTRRGSN